MELGGNIELVGFNERDSSELIVLKKIIGNFARKFSDALGEDYVKLIIDMKQIHGKTSSKFEIQAKITTKNKPIASEVTENNLFVCVADAMKKLETQIMRREG
jgi:ribosome-associated translation inhibitor RaiA